MRARFNLSPRRRFVVSSAGNNESFTDRQLQVLNLLAGGASTLRELGDRLGIHSTNGVNDHLLALERKGAIEKSRGEMKSRVWKLTALGMAVIGLRCCPTCKGAGTVAA